MEKTWTFEATTANREHVLLWNSHILVPDRIAREIRSAKPDRRIIASFNGEIDHHAALMPAGNGEYCILLNKQLRKQLALRYGDKIMVTIRLDDSQYGVPMPEELASVLAEEEDADRFFHDLTAGKQRALIHIVGKIKDPDLRIRKSWIIAEHLIRNTGRLDFKQLNEDFRNG